MGPCGVYDKAWIKPVAMIRVRYKVQGKPCGNAMGGVKVKVILRVRIVVKVRAGPVLR